MNSEEKIVELLSEILKWTRFAGAQELKNVLRSLLDTEQKRLIYHLSNGERGREEIAKIVMTVKGGTIRQYWLSWFRKGIMEPMRVRGGIRYKKSFNLEDFGFTIPKVE